MYSSVRTPSGKYLKNNSYYWIRSLELDTKPVIAKLINAVFDCEGRWVICGDSTEYFPGQHMVVSERIEPPEMHRE